MLRSLCGDLGREPRIGVLSSHTLVAEPLHPFAQERASGAVAAAGLSVGAPMSLSLVPDLSAIKLRGSWDRSQEGPPGQGDDRWGITW